MVISIIVTSMKNRIATISSIKLDMPHEIIISRKYGVGYARNWGARLSKGSLLVFLDDDLILKDGFWNEVLKVREGEFSMPVPITARVVVIHKKDFWKVGGFDEKILFVGEDEDFYCRALDSGLKFRRFPSELFVHMRHPPYRIQNIHKAVRGVRENLTCAVKHRKRHPYLLINFFWGNTKKFKFRTLLLGLTLLPYCLYKNDY